MQVLIADDHTIIRRGVRNLLEMKYASAKVDEAKSIREISDALARGSYGLVILDLLLTYGNAFDHVGDWVRTYPDTSFMVYSQCSQHLYGPRLMALGCKGFISKEEPEEHLLEAVETLRKGLPLRTSWKSSSVDSKEQTMPFDLLSDREVRVMEEILRGNGIKEISQMLDISPSTVATYKSRLFDKLGVNNDMELRRLAEIHAVFRS